MRRRTLPALLAFLALAGASALPAQEEAAATTETLLALETVRIEVPVPGEPPGPESLVRLTVAIANRGERIASALVFRVEVAGQELPVYRNQVFLKAIPPGGTTELRLYNFWTGETGRSAPADGKLAVVVTLEEASWMEVADEEGVEVWKPLGAVEGLPVTASTVVALKKGE